MKKRMSTFGAGRAFVLGVLAMTSAEPGLPAAGPDAPALTIADYTADAADLGWRVVNDNVMGGRSEGGFTISDDALEFRGRTNTNGGGFSSIRTGPLRMDLSAQTGIRLKVRGDGRRYTWRLATNARWRGRPVGYWAEFDTRPSEWQTVDLPFDAFYPQVFGYRLDGPPLDLERITGMGLMIYDKLDGDFELSLARVAAYASEPFSLSAYRWQRRVLVINALSANDERLAALANELEASKAAFDDRDLLLVTLLDEGVSTAGEQPLNDGEVAALRKSLAFRPGEFGIRLVGKDGSIKLSSEAATAGDVYALIDTMPMRRRETARQ
jgi:hypothetical protein